MPITKASSNAVAAAALGDLVVGSATNDSGVLPIGTTGQVLTVAAGTASWATPSSGSMTLLSTTTLSGASTTVSSISGAYTDLVIVVHSITAAADGNALIIRPNSTASIAWHTGTRSSSTSISNDTVGDYQPGVAGILGTGAINASTTIINNYASSSIYKTVRSNTFAKTAATPTYIGENRGGGFLLNSAITSLYFSMNGTNFTGGTVLLYGVK